MIETAIRRLTTGPPRRGVHGAGPIRPARRRGPACPGAGSPGGRRAFRNGGRADAATSRARSAASGSAAVAPTSRRPASEPAISQVIGVSAEFGMTSMRLATSARRERAGRKRYLVSLPPEGEQHDRKGQQAEGREVSDPTLLAEPDDPGPIGGGRCPGRARRRRGRGAQPPQPTRGRSRAFSSRMSSLLKRYLKEAIRCPDADHRDGLHHAIDRKEAGRAGHRIGQHRRRQDCRHQDLHPRADRTARSAAAASR